MVIGLRTSDDHLAAYNMSGPDLLINTHTAGRRQMIARVQ